MRFKLHLQSQNKAVIPINYQYPLSAAIYKILAKADEEYAAFLHETGYGRGFKLFCFSDLKGKIKVYNDRFFIADGNVSFEISFHLPEASKNFIKGLFLSQQIDIADKKSLARFTVSSVESLANPLQRYKENEIIHIQLKPRSAIVAGVQDEQGKYEFLSPADERFVTSIIYNWRNKIKTCYDKESAESAILFAETIPMQSPYKSRLITIKAGTSSETRIRGWLNFGLKVTGEKKFVEVLMDSGAGQYSSQGMGFVGI